MLYMLPSPIWVGILPSDAGTEEACALSAVTKGNLQVLCFVQGPAEHGSMVWRTFTHSQPTVSTLILPGPGETEPAR